MTAQSTARPTVAGARGRALLAALGLALAAAVLPATAAHASPQSPDTGSQLTNPGGNPQPPEPPDPPQVGPEDLANPTENPEPPLPPDPPEDQDPVSTGGDSIPTPQRVDAGFGGTATGPHQAAGLALIAAALMLTLLVIVIARRHHDESGSIR
jgi:hypothetical protein